MTFSVAQEADIEAAQRDIQRLIGTIYRTGDVLTDQQIEERFEEINRNYSSATLRSMLMLLNEQLALIHHRLAACVEFGEAPAGYWGERIEAEEQKTEECVQLAMQHAECIDEIGLIRMCLGYRLRQGACL